MATPILDAIHEVPLIGLNEEIQNLINNGVDVNERNEYNETPLMNVSEWEVFDNDQLEIAKTLIQAGADVNAQDNIGSSALYRATINDNLELIKLLLKSGANINIKNDDGETPFIIATLGKDEILNYLIKAGADVNAQDKHGYTALMMAVFNDDLEMIEVLINAGARIDIKNKMGTSAIDIARQEGNLNIVNYITNYIKSKARNASSLKQSFFTNRIPLYESGHWYTGPIKSKIPDTLTHNEGPMSNVLSMLTGKKGNYKQQINALRTNIGLPPTQKKGGRRSTRRHKRSKRKTTHRRRR